jgi:hypothetical protein
MSQRAIAWWKKCGLRRFAGNDEMVLSPATNWHDGQITKSLSIPLGKNIPLNVSGKSAA